MGAALPGAVALAFFVWLGYEIVTGKAAGWIANQRTATNAANAPPQSNPSPPQSPASGLPLNADYQAPGTSVVLPGAPFFQPPGGAGGASYPSWRGW